ncbi:hypothetical protein IQ255_24890 [Pleurocapsales cyanobacterium LEGE 10410]|nr:hypothetical protein [Pleurocapsales cyanobacterium LEGE 10410]
MTASKPRQRKYDENYDPRPKTVSIGISLITVETDSFIQDDRHVEIPVDDDIVYLTVPREIVFLPCGGASYDIIADLLEQEGYLRKHWKIMSVWTCVSPEEEPF